MGKLLPRKRGTEPRPEGVWRVPKRYNFTRDVVEAFAADPDRPALTFVDGIGVIDRWTFRDVAYEASRWSALFRSRGLGPGDRVLVLVGRTPAWPAALLGALKAGLVTVPCSETSRASDLESRVENSGARLGVTDRAHAPMLREMREPIAVVVVEEAEEELRALPTDAPTHDTAATDIAFLLDPSGSAGPPQEATHGDGYAWAKHLQAEHWLDAQSRDLVWCAVETGSAQSIQDVLLGPWSNGVEIVIHDGEFDPEQRLDLVQRLGVTALCQTPSEYQLMAQHPSTAHFDLALLRHAVSIGGPVDPGVIRVWREAFGLTVYDGYTPAAAAVPVQIERVQAPTQHDDRALRDDVLLEATQAAPAKARHGETEARRAATVRVKEDERQRKQEDKRRQEQAKAAAAQSRRSESEARRASEAQAKEDERQRKQEDKRRQEEAKAAAAQSRRDAEARHRAERTAEDAQRAAEADAAGTEGEPENDTNPVLVSRLLAYGRLDTGSSERRAE